jgi:hypothetical protein
MIHVTPEYEVEIQLAQKANNVEAERILEES